MSKGVIGLLFTVAAVCNFVARPIAGQLAIRIGEGILMRGAATLMTVAALIPAVAQDAGLLWVASMFYGMAVGIFLPASLVYLGRIFQAETRSLAVALYSTMSDVGYSLGSAVSAGILEIFSFFAVFTTASLVGLTTIGSTSTRVKKTDEGKTKS